MRSNWLHLSPRHGKNIAIARWREAAPHLPHWLFWRRMRLLPQNVSKKYPPAVSNWSSSGRALADRRPISCVGMDECNQIRELQVTTPTVCWPRRGKEGLFFQADSFDDARYNIRRLGACTTRCGKSVHTRMWACRHCRIRVLDRR